MPFIPVALPEVIRAGGTIGGAIFGKRKRSACRAVSPADVEGFRAGTVVPHVVWERAEDIVDALGVSRGTYVQYGGAVEYLEAKGIMRFRDVADLHLSVFVPLCQTAEGSNLTDDPASGPGLATYNAARASFKDQIRSGRVPALDVPRGGGGAVYDPSNQYGVPGGLPGPPQDPAKAGFGGATALLLGLGALFFLRK